ncbi:arabinose efflux permease family protein [Schinkia azotoformans MEV2011]|uniref:Arabinose efflux permease family protein n=1 Tax=Schinkia azotoformans MEV2011 TaxID=1348973 RepID=A0A072NQL7_SCHAZ|nr:MFS transporter [Schinkia azotoformans]KEF39163.1 arabinose efflux permease family protein [Schinkia azotoformans MEV2011]
MINEASERIFTKNFILLFLTNFFLFIAYYSFITALPIYVLDELKGSEAQAGLVVTMLLISAIIVRPFSGKILELFGRKETLIISLVFYLFGTIMHFWIINFYTLMALRFFHGIWFSIITTATYAIAADIVPEHRRGEGLGYFTMSMNIAIVAGPFITIVLLGHAASFQTLFILLTVLSVGTVFITAFIRVPKLEINHLQSKLKFSMNDLFEKKSIPIAVIALLLTFAYSSILSYLTIFAKSLGLLEAASYFFIVFAASMLIARPFVGRLFDKKGPTIVIYPLIILFSIGLFLLTVTKSALLLIVAAAFIGIGYGSLGPCFQTLAVQFAGKNRSGHATATYLTFFDIGIAVGAYVLGLIVSHFSYSGLFLFAGIVALSMLVLFKPVYNKSQALVEESFNETAVPLEVKMK